MYYGTTEPGARAAIAAARALSRVPATITDDERANLAAHFPAAHVEWIVLAIAMMGFLNKFMDAVGVELEAGVASEVQGLIAPLAGIRENTSPAWFPTAPLHEGQAGMRLRRGSGDTTLAGEVEKLSRRCPHYVDDARAQAALGLARAASSSPSQIDTEVVGACRASRLGAAAIIEIVVWLSVLQMLHRLSAFYRT